MLYDCKRISYRIDRRLTGLAGPEYVATISFGLPFEPQDSQYGKSRLKAHHLEGSPIHALATGQVENASPTSVVIKPESVELPAEALLVPLSLDGRPVRLMLVQDRRSNGRTYNLLKWRVGRAGAGPRGTVCQLGVDLPVDLVEGLRRSVYSENLRRQASFDAAGSEGIPARCPSKTPRGPREISGPRL